MAYFKNTASQYVLFVARDLITDANKTGDSLNITVAIYNGTSSAASTNSVSEIDATNHPGIYKLILTQEECNYEAIGLTAKSTTSGVQIDPVLIAFLPTVATVQSGLATQQSVDTVTSDVSTVDGKIDTLTSNLSTTDGKVDTIDGLVDDLTTDLAAVDGKVDVIDGIVDTIVTKTNTIGGATITYTTPVLEDGTAIVYAGQSHDSELRLSWTIEDWAGPDIEGNVVFTLVEISQWQREKAAADFTFIASATQHGDTVTVSVALNAADTDSLTTGGTKRYHFETQMTTLSDELILINSGTLIVYPIILSGGS